MCSLFQIKELVILTNNVAIQKAFLDIPNELFNLGLDELYKKAHPTITEKRLVISFTAECFKVLSSRGRIKFKTKALSRSICSYNHFYYRILKNPIKLLWLLNSVVDREDLHKEFLLVCDRPLPKNSIF